MNSKEVLELKKTLRYTDCSIQRVIGCYVDPEKELHMIDNINILSIPEEDQHKYFALVNKGLSGKIGKNLLNITFRRENGMAVANRDQLMNVLDAAKANDYETTLAELEVLYKNINDSCGYEGNYFLMTVYGVYDVPGMTSDGLTMDDASDTIYNFTLTLVCPMKPSKAGLTYNRLENSIENVVRSMIIEEPVHGFLFPAFNDRCADIHNVLYYTRKAEDINGSLIDLLGCEIPSTVSEQNDTFVNVIETVEDLTFDKVKAVYSNIRELDKEAREQGEAPVVDANVAKRVLEESGFAASEVETVTKKIEKIEKAENVSAENEEDGAITKHENNDVLLSNLFGGSNKLKIKTGTSEITVPVESADFVDLRKIDGRNCIVIEINDSVTVNGISVKKFV